MTTQTEALKRIAAYPFSRAEELSVEQMREIAREALAQPETPYEIGKRIAKIGGGMSHLWSAVSHDGELAEAERGFKEALAQQEQEPRTADEKLARMKSELAYMRQAQPEQEPVAHMNQHGVIHEAGYPWGPTNRLEPLYTTPPQRKPLTDEQIAHATAPVFMGGEPSLTGIARAIEAAHGIKGDA